MQTQEERLLGEVRAAADALARHREVEKELLHRRNVAIIWALESGLSQRIVAASADVQRGMLWKIRDGG